MLIRPVESLDQRYEAIRKKMESDYNANNPAWQAYWREAMINLRLEAGDGTFANKNFFTQTPSSNFYFNTVRPLGNMVSGRQRQKRKSPLVQPMTNADQETADQWTKVLLNIFKREGVYNTISEAFHQGAFITGMNLLHCYLDFSRDPMVGDVKVDNLAFNEFYIDPFFRKLDLSDCNFVWRRTFVTHEVAASLLPDKDFEKVMSLPGNPSGTARDSRFQYMPENFAFAPNNRVAYDEYYYRDFREQTLIYDTETGDNHDVSFNTKYDIDRFLEDNPQVVIKKQQIPTVNLAISIQNKVFYDGRQSTNSDLFPFCPVIGYYSPSLPYFHQRIQSMCTSLRDPQALLNRRIILSADLAESTLNTGWIFKENAVIDPQHLFQVGQGRVIPLKAEAQMTDLQAIVPPNIPPSFFQLQETFSQLQYAVTGISEELMGQADDSKVGITEILRQSAGLVTLQPLFDRLDNSMCLLETVMMDIIRKNYTPGKIQQFLEGEAPTAYFYEKTFGEYHCMVQEGFNTESQKQMEMAQLVQLGGILPEGSIPGWAYLEAATIQNKDKIIKAMQEQKEATDQMQQMEMQIKQQEAQARIELAQARAVADQGLGVERISRVQENQALAVERRAQAIRDEDDGLLSKVRALKELESMDIAHLRDLMDISTLLQENDRQNKLANQVPLNQRFAGVQ